uniref:SHSP domain-containing protein n=1 Tax=Plectus sambesii TaxID=2011161 RepID=A0A914WXF0_9BILA
MAFYRNLPHHQWNHRWDSPAPEQLHNQFFGEPITGPHHPSVMYHHPLSVDPYYMHPVQHADACVAEELGTGFSDVHNDAKQFAVRLDVSHFKPEEVTRSFVRKYSLPGECNLEQVKSQLSHDSVLTVSAPKVVIKGKPERLIPISAAPNEEKKDKSKKQQAIMNGH